MNSFTQIQKATVPIALLTLKRTESSTSTLLDHVPMRGKLSLEQYHQELSKPEEVLRCSWCGYRASILDINAGALLARELSPGKAFG